MRTGGNNITRMSPRQKMINLMYIVLTAMLALNVSSDVLDGFNRVHESIAGSSQDLRSRSDVLYSRMEQIYAANPRKAAVAYHNATEARGLSRALCSRIDSLMLEVARKADGADGNPAELKNREDLEAATEVLLNPVNRRGAALRKQLDDFRACLLPLLPEGPRRDNAARQLSTAPKSVPGSVGKVSWEQSNFEGMPAIAAITLLRKLQNDVLHAEAEAVANMITSVDIGDVRVNELSAYVIPRSNMVMRGSRYAADIVLAAIDTTKRPDIFVGGRKIPSGHYEFVASSAGTHQLSGYMEVAGADGNITRRPFSSSYTVVEPMATISATMMNVLYAGIDNPVAISVPGVPMSGVQASMTNGTLRRSGDSWVARPSKIGTDAVVSVTANVDGHAQRVATMKFRVRKLPDPTPYIAVSDGSSTLHYKGTPRRISRRQLLSADGLGAAADDEMLNVAYTVVGFSTVFFDSMGNAIPEKSDGSRFSARQKEQFRRLKPGKRFFITSVKAKGPDGMVRDISPMEVAVN